MMKAEDLRAASALPVKSVHVKAVGGDIALRALSALDQAEFYDRVSKAREGGATWDDEGESVVETLRSSVELSAFLISRMVVAENERGALEAVFTEREALVLSEAVMTALAGACFAYIDELAPEGNSEAVQDGSSSSG